MRPVSGSVLQSGFRLFRIVGLCAVAFAAIPAQGAMALPSGMHYELVSPVDTGGTGTFPRSVSPDGSRIQVGSYRGQGFGGTLSFNDTVGFFVASRSAQGWETVAMNPPGSPNVLYTAPLDFSADLSLALSGSADREQYHASQYGFVLTGVDGSANASLPVMTDLVGSLQDDKNYIMHRAVGASGDLSHLVFDTSAKVRLLASDGPVRFDAPADSYRLYEAAGLGTPDATLRRVDVDNGGAEIGPACLAVGYGSGSQNGSQTNVISSDGNRLFFSARPGANVTCNTATFPVKVFARVGGTQTVELSASECQRPGCSSSSGDAEYQAASENGDRVAFLSSDQLADSDTDSTADLYQYDFNATAGHHLAQLSVGDSSGGRTPGAGALAQGLVSMSDDGSRVYFIARGVLTTGLNTAGQGAAPAANNLYLYEPSTNKTTFIARVASTNISMGGGSHAQPADVSDASAAALVFSTTAQLLPSDTDAVADVYHYDAVSGTLAKASPGNTPEAAEIPGAQTGQKGKAAPPITRMISSDGRRVVFATNAALVPEDINGKSDVYLWDNGVVQLVSDGQDPAGVGQPPNAVADYFSIAAAGDQVLFATNRRLVPEDVDDVGSVYVAREGEDIVRIPDTTEHCSGDACQGPVNSPPASFVAGSELFSGAGNLAGGERFAIGGLRKPSGADRSKLARGGKARLKVSVSRAGTVTLRGSAPVGGRTRRVVSTSTKAQKAGTVTIPFRLSRAARGELKRRGSLSLSLSVRFGDARPKAVAVILRATNGRKGGRS